MKLNKKAQQSRNDLAVWYAVCFVIVLVTVGALYGLGFIGNGFSHGSLIDSNKITAAAIAVPVEEAPVEQINDSDNSTVTDGE
ncbi:hypothetical protein GOV06_05435 [Candidatus Woesearchaeota archaeon]|nr:hypothetical protein [Candidatus Woesearchaeota archaeon]